MPTPVWSVMLARAMVASAERTEAPREVDRRLAITRGRDGGAPIPRTLRDAFSATKAAMPIAGFFVIGAATGTRIAEDGASASPVDGNR
jgi:hypothetical protein